MAENDKIAVNTVFANIGKAIEGYERLLISRNAPFDRYVAGEQNAIGIEAKRGLDVFIGKGGCILCHDGANFTDNDFHNVGVPQGRLPLDIGRSDGIQLLLENPFNGGGIYSDDPEVSQSIIGFLKSTQRDIGKFKTPTLRNVALTAPYFHTGEYPTLESILSFNGSATPTNEYAGMRDDTRQPLELSAQEVNDLLEFLLTLTGELPPAHLLRKPVLP